MPFGINARAGGNVRTRIPRMFVEFADRRVAAVYIAFGAAPLYLTLLSNNGYVLLLADAVGPLLAICFLLIRPPNPYRSLYARFGGLENANVREDAVAAEVVVLLASRKARKLIVRTGLGCSIMLFAVTSSVAYLRWAHLNWALEPWPFTIMCLFWGLWALGPQYHVLMRWVLCELQRRPFAH